MKQSTANSTPDKRSIDEDIFDARERLVNFQGNDLRPGQMEAVKAVLCSDKKVIAISAPTGTGKSLIGMIAGMLHDRFCYLCSTKQLQRQMINDFPEARHMVGRNNFACNQDKENRTADLCIHSNTTPCDLKQECFYELHKKAVMENPYQILNYHYILNEANYIGKFSGYPVIVADEADVLESLLTSFTELKIHFARLHDIKLSPPAYRTNTAKHWIDSCKKWAEDAQLKVNSRLKILHSQIMEFTPNKKFTPGVHLLVREYKTLRNLSFKLTMFNEHVDDSWIFQEVKENGHTIGWKFQPTWLSPGLSENYFFRHGYKFVLMSATLPPKQILAHMLGLETEDIELIELTSAFPAENRPVYLNTVADMGYQTFEDDLPALLAEIQRLVDKHPNLTRGSSIPSPTG
jgi:Rad3-related DNA helicase